MSSILETDIGELKRQITQKTKDLLNEKQHVSHLLTFLE
jgi:hypothetical protein